MEVSQRDPVTFSPLTHLIDLEKLGKRIQSWIFENVNNDFLHDRLIAGIELNFLEILIEGHARNIDAGWNDFHDLIDALTYFNLRKIGELRYLFVECRLEFNFECRNLLSTVDSCLCYCQHFTTSHRTEESFHAN